jgi:pimeloyl-ACP methyl ester carboxylesterase
MNFNTSDIAGIRLFYREAGHPSKPTIVLLHGFPSSSYQFQDLIPRLADRFHVIAPDYPGMGYSEAPATSIGWAGCHHTLLTMRDVADYTR